MSSTTQPTPARSGATAQPATRREMRRAWEHSELAPVSARPPFVEYLHQLWDRRHFIRVHALSQAMGQHQGTLLGNIWLVLAPLLDGAMYWFIFGVIFKASAGVPDFLARLLIGILMFAFFSRAVNACAGSLTAGRGLIRAFSFPRACLPLAAVCRELVSQVPTFVAMLVLILLVPPHAHVTPLWLLAPLPLLLMAGVVAGIGFVAARLTSIIPDLGKLIPYVTRLLLYTSGVIFVIERFATHPHVLAVIQANPIYIYIEMTRSLLLYGVMPPVREWLLLLAWAVALSVLGLLFFWRGEVTYGRQRST